MSIEVENITKTFGSYRALSEINLHVQSGELVALLGPSGCGKTTLLRIVAGLETPDCGHVYLNGADTSGYGPGERNIGFVFQHYALFRHMTVFENVAFGLDVAPKKRRLPKPEIRRKVSDLLALVQMDWAERHLPHQLSGGQRQRIVLARALAIEPKVLLLDEPFSALDAKVRVELRRWLRKLHDELHITSIFVTHDQEEALELADRVVIINKGKTEQIGTPEEVYENPANAFVYNFLGNVNVFHCCIEDARIGKLTIETSEFTQAEDSPVSGFIRPHDEGNLFRNKSDSRRDKVRFVGRSVDITDLYFGRFRIPDCGGNGRSFRRHEIRSRLFEDIESLNAGF